LASAGSNQDTERTTILELQDQLKAEIHWNPKRSVPAAEKFSGAV